jgi:CDP-4-dehydro-6-deoxyglucose reductase, E3
MKISDIILVRGPLGNFILFSERETSIIFIARGTGFAPIKSMIDQLLKIGMIRYNILIFWGAHDSDVFYELDVIDSWIKQNTQLKMHSCDQKYTWI